MEVFQTAANQIARCSYKPNFFIVGAPKCGTTALHYFLQQHPQIFLPEDKEPHFFGGSEKRAFPNQSVEKYLSLFKKGKDYPLRGEASTWYLHSSLACHRIYQAFPGAKIIIMLRNPIDMIYSLHNQLLYSGEENEPNFSKALSFEKDREKGRKIPSSAHTPERLLYTKVGFLSSCIHSYIKTFGRHQVHFILHEDLKSDPFDTLKEVFFFLGVDDSVDVNIQTVNANKQIKSQKFQVLLQRFPDVLRKPLRLCLPRNVRLTVLKKIKLMNTAYVARPPLDDATRMELRELYDNEIKRLSELMGRPLPW